MVARPLGENIAEVRRRVGAFAIAEIGAKLKSSANYTALYIAPEDRKQYLATVLTMQIMEAALERDKTKMRLWAVGFDEIAISVHEKLGFTRTKITTNKKVAGSPNEMKFVNMALNDLSGARAALQRTLEEKGAVLSSMSVPIQFKPPKAPR